MQKEKSKNEFWEEVGKYYLALVALGAFWFGYKICKIKYLIYRNIKRKTDA